MKTPMTRARVSAPLTSSALGAMLLLSTACGIDVHHAEQGKNVDIRTPVGALSVRTDTTTAAIGLPVYPGAVPMREHGETESADVNITSPWFGVKVQAAKYESADAPDKVLGFYKQQMKTFGDVTECQGDVDFKGPSGSKRPVCKEKLFSRDVQLVTGTEDRQRVVSVKPRGSGSEFALVYVNTRSES